MLNSSHISKILVFSEEPRARVLVGELTKQAQGYSFAYDEGYMERATATPLGPDLPFSAKPIESKIFFESLRDLIPSRENPEYENYCRRAGIDPKESDPMMLLAALGGGPSSFVFTAAPESDLPKGEEIVRFREALGLSQRQFATFFGVPFPTLQAVEKDSTRAETTRRLIEVFLRDPGPLRNLLVHRGIYLGQKQQESVEGYVRERMMKTAERELSVAAEFRGLGYLEVFHLPMGLGKEWTQLELLEAARKAECPNTGWPIGVVLTSEGKRPIFEPDGIGMKLETYSGGYDEWALTRDGGFRFFRMFGEDRETRPAKSQLLHFDIRIWRIAEAVEHARRLYEALGLPAETRIRFVITHGGLKGRRIASSTPLRLEPFPPRIASADVSRLEKTLSLADLSVTSGGLVEEICRELFVLFNGWQISKEALQQIVGEYSKSRIGH